MIEVQIETSLLTETRGLQLELNFKVPLGHCLAIYGASGAGKTTLLRILAGLMQPDRGRITYQQDVWLDTDQRINVSPQKRGIGFLFQDYALFPHMSVRENLEFALVKGQSRAAIANLMEIMEIGPLQDYKPCMLSGGQKQRVALARALVQQPKVLLLDEPLSALDNEMRRKLQDYLLQVHRTFHLTTFLVSHDIAEIYKIADEVLMLNNGKGKQWESPAAAFQHRAISGKFQFLGEVIAIDAQDFLWIISVLVGREVVRIVADGSEAKLLKPGDQVLVASKAFNPVIRKFQTKN